MKKIAISFLLTVFFVVLSSSYINAQDPGQDPDEIPLDPGSWVLVAAGVGYGVKKWRDSRLKTNGNDENNAGLPGEK